MQTQQVYALNNVRTTVSFAANEAGCTISCKRNNYLKQQTTQQQKELNGPAPNDPPPVTGLVDLGPLSARCHNTCLPKFVFIHIISILTNHGAGRALHP
jgi:hypothetical protein